MYVHFTNKVEMSRIKSKYNFVNKFKMSRIKSTLLFPQFQLGKDWQLYELPSFRSLPSLSISACMNAATSSMLVWFFLLNRQSFWHSLLILNS